MKEGPGTRLPEPARELWLRTREVIRSNLHGLQDPPVEYRLGGGTILAARWLHRESADIDITVDDDTSLHRLGDPVQSAFEEQIQIEALGGESRFLRSDDCLIYQEMEDRVTHWRTAARAMNLPLLRDRKQKAEPT